jgi:photosystem II stability/assembly factor-like uncharacterized protein
MSEILYAGTRAGMVVLKSQDGDSWEVEAQGLSAWEVPKVAVSVGQPNRIVAGTRGDGVWISEDFGKSWGKPSYGNPEAPGKVRCVTLDSRDPNTIYAGTEPINIFRSRDGAKSWERLASVWDVPSVASIGYPVPTVEPHVREVTQDPHDPDTLYAALQVGYMLKSTDGGDTWRLLDQGLDEDVHTIVIDPKDSNNMYIATGGEGARRGNAAGRAFYRSHDAGENWTPMAMEFPHTYSIPMAIHPTNTTVLYGGMATTIPSGWNRPTGAESVVVRSENGGDIWELVGGALLETSRTCPASIVFDSEDPDHIYIGFQNGEIYASRDAGGSWHKLDVSLPPIANLTMVQA